MKAILGIQVRLTGKVSGYIYKTVNANNLFMYIHINRNVLIKSSQQTTQVVIPKPGVTLHSILSIRHTLRRLQKNL